MIKKIETLLCVQEFVKDQKLMEKYFSGDDIECMRKYCSRKLMDVDLNDSDEKENVSRVIQLLLNSDLHLHVNAYKDNVRSKISLQMIFTQLKIFCSHKDFPPEENVPVEH